MTLLRRVQAIRGGSRTMEALLAAIDTAWTRVQLRDQSGSGWMVSAPCPEVTHLHHPPVRYSLLAATCPEADLRLLRPGIGGQLLAVSV